MKKLLIALSAVTALAVVPAAFAQNAPAPAAAPMYGKHERHPEIHRALNALHAAHNDLAHAAHDFGGHRAKAQALVDEAIQELKAALAYDKG